MDLNIQMNDPEPKTSLRLAEMSPVSPSTSARLYQRYLVIFTFLVFSFFVSIGVMYQLLNDVKTNMDQIKTRGDQAIMITQMGSLLGMKFARIADYANMPTQQAIDEYMAMSQEFNQLELKVKPVLRSKELGAMLDTLCTNSDEIDRLFLGSVIRKVNTNQKDQVDLDLIKAARIRANTDVLLENLRTALLAEQQASLVQANSATDKTLWVMVACVLILLLAATGIMVVELRSGERRYGNLFFNLLNGLIQFEIVLDHEGNPSDFRIIEVNHSIEKMMGVSGHAFRNRLLTQVYPQSNQADFDWLGALLEVVATGRPARFEAYFQPLKRWFSVSAYQLGKRHLVTELSDITRRKQADEEVRALNTDLERKVEERTLDLTALNEELQAINDELHESNNRLAEENQERMKVEAILESTNRELQDALNRYLIAQTHLVQSEKMASLGQLVAGVAHEINTPLGMGMTATTHLNQLTSGLAEQYRNGSLKRGEMERYLREAETAMSIITPNLERAAHLIRSFKQVSIDQSAEMPRSFKVREYLDEIMLSLHPRIKKTRHTIQIHCDNELAIDCDPGSFAQIITNLVMNALIHAYGPSDEGHVGIDVRHSDGNLYLTFSDDGKGMDEATLARVFDPFFTTNRGSGGTGLGLFVLYNLVTGHFGGKVECESKPGQGTTFRICFPVERNTL
ncbi:MAG: ATP-binding protein [Solirubrobacterales bacterium]